MTIDRFVHQITSLFHETRIRMAHKRKLKLAHRRKTVPVSLTKKAHVNLIIEFAKLTKIINTRPEVMKLCQAAKDHLDKTPIGLPVANPALIYDALSHADAVKDHEPQVKASLQRIKPLLEDYLDREKSYV